MTYREILSSMWANPPELTKEDIDNLDKKYIDIRKRIDDNLDYFAKLCTLSSYAHELNSSVSIDTVADQLTEAVDEYVFYKICKPNL